MEEIIFDKEAKNKLRSGINKLSKAVISTYGPNGNTVIISDEWGNPYITKDGVSVARSIHFKDPIENIGAQLIKQAAAKTLEEAGDGTTTSICLANAFINKGYELLDNNISYKNIQLQLNNLLEHIPQILEKSAIKIEKENIYNVAKISANGDDKIANIIQEAFNHSKIVKVEEGNKSEDELITYNGMKLNGNIFDKAFINNASKQSIDYNNAVLIIISGKLEKIEKVSEYLLDDSNKNFIIIADHFSESVVSILKDNYNRGALSVGLVKSPGFAQHRKDLIRDIIAYTNAKPYKKESIHIALIDGFTATKNNFTIRKDTPSSEMLLNSLKVAYKDDRDNDLLKQRIDNLEGTLSIIKVGGQSEVEMKERFDRIEDAVLAVQSALEEGVVTGAGISLFDIANHSISRNKPMWECLSAPYLTIFPQNIGKQEILENVVDPVKVIKCALKNAVSVAKTILSTDAIVLNESQWK